MNLTWTGTDVLYATTWPKYLQFTKYPYLIAVKIFAKLADLMIENHIVVSEHLKTELSALNLRKNIIVRENPVIYSVPVKKIKHEGFNVLYYRPIGSNQKFKDWLYGYDIVEKAIILNPVIKFICVSGYTDMNKIYSVTDLYIRPNRHDGSPRMVRECKINNIPVYHSYSEPSLVDMIDMIYNLSYEKKVSNS